MLAYLMLFAALFNAVCLRNAFFLLLLPLIFANALCFHTLSWFIDTVRLIHVLIFIMHSAFNLVYPNFMFTPFSVFFFNERAICTLEKIALKNNHYYGYVIIVLRKQENSHNF